MIHNFVADVETLAASANAAVTSIAIVYVQLDAKANIVEQDTFYARVNPHPSCDISTQTLDWWQGNCRTSREEAGLEGELSRISEPLALELAARFMEQKCQDPQLRTIWGYGAAFDNAILQEAYRRHGLPIPWHYSNNLCARTLIRLYLDAKRLTPFVGIKHYALDDAKHEAAMLTLALQLRACSALAHA